MSRSMEEIVEWILGEISFSGINGITVTGFIELIDHYYSTQNGLVQSPVVETTSRGMNTSCKTDQATLRHIWAAFTASPHSLIGSNRIGNSLSLEELEALPVPSSEVGESTHQGGIEQASKANSTDVSGAELHSRIHGQHETPPYSTDENAFIVSTAASLPDQGALGSKSVGNSSSALKLPLPPRSDRVLKYQPRIKVTPDRMWQDLAGHGVDTTKVPRLEWECLCAIAAAQEKGVLQHYVTSTTGQDKTSVPRRCDVLEQKGYIIKRQVFTDTGISASGSCTSLLVHKKFSNIHNMDPGQLPEASLVGDLEPILGHERWTSSIIDTEAFVRSAVALIKAWDLIKRDELHAKLAIINMPRHQKRLQKDLRLLREAGVVELITSLISDVDASYDNSFRYRFVRDLKEEEWAFFRKKPSSQKHLAARAKTAAKLQAKLEAAHSISTEGSASKEDADTSDESGNTSETSSSPQISGRVLQESRIQSPENKGLGRRTNTPLKSRKSRITTSQPGLAATATSPVGTSSDEDTSHGKQKLTLESFGIQVNKLMSGPSLEQTPSNNAAATMPSMSLDSIRSDRESVQKKSIHDAEPRTTKREVRQNAAPNHDDSQPKRPRGRPRKIYASFTSHGEMLRQEGVPGVYQDISLYRKGKIVPATPAKKGFKPSLYICFKSDKLKNMPWMHLPETRPFVMQAIVADSSMPENSNVQAIDQRLIEDPFTNSDVANFSGDSGTFRVVQQASESGHLEWSNFDRETRYNVPETNQAEDLINSTLHGLSSQNVREKTTHSLDAQKAGKTHDNTIENQVPHDSRTPDGMEVMALGDLVSKPIGTQPSLRSTISTLATNLEGSAQGEETNMSSDRFQHHTLDKPQIKSSHSFLTPNVHNSRYKSPFPSLGATETLPYTGLLASYGTGSSEPLRPSYQSPYAAKLPSYVSPYTNPGSFKDSQAFSSTLAKSTPTLICKPVLFSASRSVYSHQTSQMTQHPLDQTSVLSTAPGRASSTSTADFTTLPVSNEISSSHLYLEQSRGHSGKSEMMAASSSGDSAELEQLKQKAVSQVEAEKRAAVNIQAAISKKASEDLAFETGMEAALKVKFPGIENRVSASLDGVPGNLYIAREKTLVTFMSMESPTTPLHIKMTAIANNPTITKRGSNPMLLELSETNDHGQSIFHSFRFPQSEEAFSAANDIRAKIVTEIVLSHIKGTSMNIANKASTPQRDSKPEKKFKCEKCGGSWLNAEGIKYHLTKARVTCNPSWKPSLIAGTSRKSRTVRKKAPVDVQDTGDILSEIEGPVSLTLQSNISHLTPRSMRVVNDLTDLGKKDLLEAVPLSKPLMINSMVSESWESQSDPTAVGLSPQIREAGPDSEPTAAATVKLKESRKREAKLAKLQREEIRAALSNLHNDPLNENLDVDESTMPVADAASFDSTKSFPKDGRPDRPVGRPDDILVRNTSEAESPRVRSASPSNVEVIIPESRPIDPFASRDIESLFRIDWAKSKAKGQTPAESRLYREIIMYILDQNDGIFPGKRAIWYALHLEYFRRVPTAKLLRSYVCNAAVKSLADSGKLRTIGFQFKSMRGGNLSRQVLTKPHVDPLSPAVLAIKQKIKDNAPDHYCPPEWSVPIAIKARLDALEGNFAFTGKNAPDKHVYNENPTIAPSDRKPEHRSRKTPDLVSMANGDEFTPRKSARGRTIKQPTRYHETASQEDVLQSIEYTDEVVKSGSEYDDQHPFGAGVKKIEEHSEVDYMDYDMDEELGDLSTSNNCSKVSRQPAQTTYMQAKDRPTWSFQPFEHGALQHLSKEFSISKPVHIRSDPKHRISAREGEQNPPGSTEVTKTKRAYKRRNEAYWLSTRDRGGKRKVASFGNEPLELTRPAKRPALSGDIPHHEMSPPAMNFQPRINFQSLPNPGLESLPDSFRQPHQHIHEVGGTKFTSRTNNDILHSALPKNLREIVDFTDSAIDTSSKIGDAFLHDIDRVSSWEIVLVPDLLQSGCVSPNSIFISHTIPSLRQANPAEAVSITWSKSRTFTLDNLPYDTLDNIEFWDENTVAAPDALFEVSGERQRIVGLEARSNLKNISSASQAVERSTPQLAYKIRYSTALPTDFVGVPKDFLQNFELAEIDRSHLHNINRRRVVLRGMTVEEELKLIIAVAIVRTLTGGTEKTIDWVIVTGCLPRYSMRYTTVVWPKIAERYKRVLGVLEAKFQDLYLEAYENEEIASIDYDNLLDHDWPSLFEWAMEKMGPYLSEAVHRLPESRSELHQTFNISEEISAHNTDPYFEPTKPIHARVEVVADVQNVVPLRSPSISPSQLSPLEIAISLARANVITPEERYNESSAGNKLRKIPKQVMSKAIQELTAAKILVRKNKGRPIPGRPFHLSDGFYAGLKQWFTEIMVDDAIAYKQHLDQAFAAGESPEIPWTVKEGQIMAITNLQAYSRVELVQSDVPMNRMGLLDGEYQSRQMSRHKLRFGLSLVATTNYVRDDENTVLAAMFSGQHDTPTEVEEALPIWVDINGHVMRDVWKKVLIAVLGVVAMRAGITMEEIVRIHKPTLQKWEVNALIQWSVSIGIMERCVHGVDGWTVREWWWLVAGKA